MIRAAISAALLVSVLVFVPIGSVIAALRQLSLWTCAGALSVLFLGHFLSAVKLRLLMGRTRVPLATCVRAQFAAVVASLGFLGMAGGDLARLAYLAPSVGPRRMAAAAVADRIIDAMTLAALIAIALPLAGWPPALTRRDVPLAWFALAAAGVAVAVLILVRLAGRYNVASRLWEARAELREMRWPIAGAFAVSSVVQSAFVATNIWIATDLGVAIGLAPWFVAWPLSKLTSILPIGLGGIGVREAAVVSFLVSFGAPADRVLASAVVWQALAGVGGVSGLALTQLLPGGGSPSQLQRWRWTNV
jgi:uncharacterized membrane protein YbhN (UPF0104 family)